MKLAWLFLSLINAQDRESKFKLKLGSPTGRLPERFLMVQEAFMVLVSPQSPRMAPYYMGYRSDRGFLIG